MGTAQKLLMVHAEEAVMTLSMSSLRRTGSFFVDEGFSEADYDHLLLTSLTLDESVVETSF